MFYYRQRQAPRLAWSISNPYRRAGLLWEFATRIPMGTGKKSIAYQCEIVPASNALGRGDSSLSNPRVGIVAVSENPCMVRLMAGQ